MNPEAFSEERFEGGVVGRTVFAESLEDQWGSRASQQVKVVVVRPLRTSTLLKVTEGVVLRWAEAHKSDFPLIMHVC